MIKRVAILFVSVLAVQAISQHQPAVQSRLGDAEDMYQKLLEVIGEAITTANNTCNEALDALKEYAVEVETEAKDAIASTLESFQQQLDDLNAQAKAKGIDVTPCRKYEVEFTQLPDTLMDQLVACVNTEITKAQNYINDAMNKAQEIQQDYYNIQQEIDDCGSGWKAVTCLAELVVKIGEDTIEGPKKISDDVDNTVITIKTLWPNVKACATSKVEAVPGEAGTIVKNFALCVAL